MCERKRVLSNFHLTEKQLSITPRDEWQLVVNQGYFLSTPVFGTPAPIGAASETAHFEKWRCLLDNIRTFYLSPHPSPQGEWQESKESASLQSKSAVSPVTLTPDSLGFPQGSQPSAFSHESAPGKPRVRSHAVPTLRKASGGTAARADTGSREYCLFFVLHQFSPTTRAQGAR